MSGALCSHACLLDHSSSDGRDDLSVHRQASPRQSNDTLALQDFDSPPSGPAYDGRTLVAVSTRSVKLRRLLGIPQVEGTAKDLAVDPVAGYGPVLSDESLVKSPHDLANPRVGAAPVLEIVSCSSQEITDHHHRARIGAAMTVTLSADSPRQAGGRPKNRIGFGIPPTEHFLKRSETALCTSTILRFVAKPDCVGVIH